MLNKWIVHANQPDKDAGRLLAFAADVSPPVWPFCSAPQDATTKQTSDGRPRTDVMRPLCNFSFPEPSRLQARLAFSPNTGIDVKALPYQHYLQHRNIIANILFLDLLFPWEPVFLKLWDASKGRRMTS